ncbi:MAG TPA: hypothetical protein VKB39_02595 [Candidatus Baltobacteraceae bacterium]|nr:hypothetical protein [Candidatus Baltobacteraceae bacterium]
MIRFDFLHDPPPRLWGAIRAARLPRRFHNVTAAVVSAVLLVAGAAAIEHGRVNEARRVRSEAQTRFESSRAELERFRLQWREIDGLIAQDRRLREIRLSGSRVAERLAVIGDLFPGGVSVDSLTTNGADYGVKGKAPTIVAVSGILGRIVANAALPHPGIVRIAKDSGVLAGFSFDFRAGDAP